MECSAGCCDSVRLCQERRAREVKITALCVLLLCARLWHFRGSSDYEQPKEYIPKEEVPVLSADWAFS